MLKVTINIKLCYNSIGLVETLLNGLHHNFFIIIYQTI